MNVAAMRPATIKPTARVATMIVKRRGHGDCCQ